jgi:predicted phosphodiesterase
MLIAVLSDIHSNLAALDAVLASIGSVDAIWHLGDVVGYGPDPERTVARLRAVGAIGVQGNHDDAVAGGESIDRFNPEGRAAAEWSRTRISDKTREYLAALPRVIVRETPAGAFTLVHGSPRDPIWEYIDSPYVAAENLAAFGTAFCLIGHSHRPLAFRTRRAGGDSMRMRVVEPEGRMQLGDRRAILNPGSVGQPRDGNPNASFLMIDTEAGVASWHRVAYDLVATQAAMAAAGLPTELIRRLARGS